MMLSGVGQEARKMFYIPQEARMVLFGVGQEARKVLFGVGQQARKIF